MHIRPKSPFLFYVRITIKVSSASVSTCAAAGPRASKFLISICTPSGKFPSLLLLLALPLASRRLLSALREEPDCAYSSATRKSAHFPTLLVK